jgi:hypothetical protein
MIGVITLSRVRTAGTEKSDRTADPKVVVP